MLLREGHRVQLNQVGNGVEIELARMRKKAETYTRFVPIKQLGEKLADLATAYGQKE